MTRDVDNRTMSDVDTYQQARIEALTRLIEELKKENAKLREMLEIEMDTVETFLRKGILAKY